MRAPSSFRYTFWVVTVRRSSARSNCPQMSLSYSALVDLAGGAVATRPGAGGGPGGAVGTVDSLLLHPERDNTRARIEMGDRRMAPCAGGAATRWSLACQRQPMRIVPSPCSGQRPTSTFRVRSLLAPDPARRLARWYRLATPALPRRVRRTWALFPIGPGPRGVLRVIRAIVFDLDNTLTDFM